MDLKAGELHVRQRADRYNAIGAPKSASGVRTIPLAPEVLSALKEWKLACPKGEADLVFPTASGQVEQHASMLRESRAGDGGCGRGDKAGKPKYGLHAFRHFYRLLVHQPKG